MNQLYDLWLTDANGEKLTPLENFSFMNYSLGTQYSGYIQLGIPLEEITSKIGNNIFQPDWRIEVRRKPTPDHDLFLERVFFLRKIQVYYRDDGITMVNYYGRDPKDLLRRRFVIQTENTTYTQKNDYADDMMKEIVKEQMLYGSARDEDGNIDNDRAYPNGYFTVQGNSSQGPTMALDVANQNVLSVLQKIYESSKDQHLLDPTVDNVIYFDVVEIGGPKGITAFEFQTFVNLRGRDQTGGEIFSVDNGNIRLPEHIEEHYDTVNVVYVKGEGRGSNRPKEKFTPPGPTFIKKSYSSPWSRAEGFITSAGTTDADPTMEDLANAELMRKLPKDELDITFISTKGDVDAPRSLYGLDWKVGDLLPVLFRGKYYEAEVKVIYVAIDDSGKENITGKTTVGV